MPKKSGKEQEPSFGFHSLRKDGQILNVREEVEKRSGRIARFTDRIGRILSSPMTFILLLLMHLLWIILNAGWIPGIKPWDPYPFTLLATIASAEAPFLSLLILMSQYRSMRVSEIREEAHLQVSLHMERELTAVLRMVDQLRDRFELELPVESEQMKELKEPLHPDHLMESVRNQLKRNEGEE